MGRGPCWISEEIMILKAHYGIKERCEIEALLPNRRWKAIRHKAEKFRLFRPKPTLPTRNLSVADLAYFAGLFDGDGSVFIRKKLTRSKYPSYSTQLNITNVHLPTIQWIRELWGLGTISLKKNPKSRKPTWQWQVVSNQALHILKITLPFLKIKKHEAEVGIALQEFKQNTHRVWGGRRPMTIIKEEQRLVKLLEDVLQ